MKSNTRAVAQAFARDQAEPSTANSVFHVDRVIYSYGSHWPLAVKLDDKRVLLNNDKRSMTTSHHRSAVAGALAMAGWTLIDGTLAECQEAINDPTYRRQLALGPVNGQE